MGTEIRQYVRDNKGNRKGVLLASKNGEVVRVSWSYCSKRDKFDVKRGMSIARNRLHEGTNAKMPHSINISAFMDRCKRYFKTENVIYVESRG